jgi:hypothetical protein
MSRDPARSHGVLAVLVDGPADLPTARLAAEMAAGSGTRLLAAVLLPLPEPAADRAAAARATARLREEASAVGARVAPTAQARAVPLTSVPLLLPPGAGSWSARRLRRAVRMLARRSGAAVVVLPDSPLAGLRPEELARRLRGAVVAGDAVRSPVRQG